MATPCDLGIGATSQIAHGRASRLDRQVHQRGADWNSRCRRFRRGAMRTPCLSIRSIVAARERHVLPQDVSVSRRWLGGRQVGLAMRPITCARSVVDRSGARRLTATGLDQAAATHRARGPQPARTPPRRWRPISPAPRRSALRAPGSRALLRVPPATRTSPADDAAHCCRHRLEPARSRRRGCAAHSAPVCGGARSRRASRRRRRSSGAAYLAHRAPCREACRSPRRRIVGYTASRPMRRGSPNLP